MQSERLRHYFLLVIIVGAIWLTSLIFAPFLKPLALAAVFAVVLQGLYKKMLVLFGRNESAAALATVVASVVLILTPLSFIGALVGSEARDLYISLETGGGQVAAEAANKMDELFGGAVPGIGEFSRSFSTNIDAYAKNALQWIVGHAGAIFSSLSSFLLSFFIFFIALFYLLRDGPRVRRALIKLSPLNDKDDDGVLVRLESAVNSVIKGNLVIALIQGALTTVGFSIFGVPHAILWGTVTVVAALIPGIGTALVFIPAITYLFLIGATVPATGLLAWGILAVGLIDNLLGPKLIGSGMKLHPLLVLLSVLGGLIFFGPTGIFLGPLTLALLFALLSIYIEDSKYV